MWVGIPLILSQPPAMSNVGNTWITVYTIISDQSCQKFSPLSDQNQWERISEMYGVPMPISDLPL